MISWISMVFDVIPPFAFLILLIWVFSLLILVRFVRDLSILFVFSKNQHFVSLILCIFFSISLISILILLISFLLLVLGFACSYFSRSLSCSVRSLIWDLSILLIYALMAINFHLWTAFAVSHRFWYVMFSFSLTYRNLLISSFISSMTHSSLSNVFSASNCLCVF
jgi:hypothetical protein